MPNAPSAEPSGPKGQGVAPGARPEPTRPGQTPSISLPKGGGAIKGIGEKFASNPVTGTGTMTIPLATSPGRSGFGPELSLSYDSGAGNGVFGFGWSLSLPAITRKTDKGLPRYLDADESDVFVLSGSEDLVPVLVETAAGWELETLPPRNVDGDDFQVRRYRPRSEGLFSRVERWTNVQTGDIHWRSITRDNVTTLYGKDDNSRIFAPPDPATGELKRIFKWLICQTFDDKGNAIVYEYVPEDDENVGAEQVNERNRIRKANRYLKSIKYGNRVSRLIQPNLALAQWLFEVVFDYDEGRYEELPLDPGLTEAEQHSFVRAALAPSATWPARPDPFSSHRSGFEVRTYRRCHRVLMFHCFPELGLEPCLVRSTELEYTDFDYSLPNTIEQELTHQGSTRFASFIQGVTQSGYVRDPTRPVAAIDGVNFVTYLKKSLPPVEFTYSKANIREEIRAVDAASLRNLPVGLNGTSYQWVDLNGEGVSGILTEQAGSWFYKPNLGDGNFGPLETVSPRPSLSNLGSGRQQLLDLAGDGQLDLVSFVGPTSGFFERTADEDWENFKAFVSLPNVKWDEPNLRFIDLTGDGHADILITEDEVFTWYPSLAEDGFDSAVQVRKAVDEERGPRLVFADRTQSIYLADMCGDGLADFVRLRNGEICYWPNLGYGRFGAKVTMDNAPWFDSADQFSQQRVRLADIDGSGASDIIYLGREAARLYFNQSGNRWSEARALTQFPPVDDLSTVITVDLLGNGTACLVWGSPLPSDAQRPMCYIDLMGGKPHLIVKTVNNLGAETLVEYASSTKFYLADKQAGRPWITKIPFPVHVVERVETYDRISGNRFVSRYEYHHGYFDGVEREFRGFGLVEQRDTEEFAALNANQQFPAGTNIDQSSHVPPMLTRTWFHTGVYLSRHHVSDFFAGLHDDLDVGEYYREPGLTDSQARALLLDDTILPSGLTVAEERDACRALKGSMLRQEVYAEDGTEKAPHPYTVSEQNFTIELVQPQLENKHAAFFIHPREVLSYHYERVPTDPRVTHTLTFEVDEFGNVRKDASIAYGRRQTVTVIDAMGNVSLVTNPGLAELGLTDQARQTATLITYGEYDFTNPITEDDNYRGRLSSDRRTYELTGLLLPGAQKRFTFNQVLAAGMTAAPLDYEVPPTPGLQEKRLLEQQRKLYRRDDLTGPLLLNELHSLALPFQTLQLAFTPGLVTNVFAGRVTEAMLENEARYVHSEGDGNWWIPSGREFYSPNTLATPAQELAEANSHFFLSRRHRDPFHTNTLSTETLVTYDNHDLLLLQTLDPLGNRTTAGQRDSAENITAFGHDYRVLQPRLITDPNRNQTAIAFDAFGFVAGTAVMGKADDNPPQGDFIEPAFRADLTQAEIDQFVANPRGPLSTTLLGQASSRIIYDLTTYSREPDQAKQAPVFSATLSRETHVSDPVPAGGLKIHTTFSYTDGFGREIQKKLPAEPGPAPQRDVSGKILTGANGQPLLTDSDVSPRWVGSGWTIVNNKGKPVRQYEPYFTDTHRFEFDVRIGISPVAFYDPTGRLVAKTHPNHTWQKVVFDSWRQETWDASDTVLIDSQFDAEVGPYLNRLPDNEYLPSWWQQRNGGALGIREQEAARKTAIHASTPTVEHFDSLGRPFLSIAHNRFKYSDTPAADPPVEEFYRTLTILDIEGNQREIIDAKDRVVMHYDYDIAGTAEERQEHKANNRIHHASLEAGERWMLEDVAGKPLYVWDSQDQRIRSSYDPLRRPKDSLLREGANAELLVARNVYGEELPNPELGNLRGKIGQLFDQAGVVSNKDYDFKGNLLHSERQVAQAYKSTLNWLGAVPFEAETYVSRTRYDALNRPTELTGPDNSVIRHTYNDANLLERIEANLRGEALVTSFVNNIHYDAKGQRISVDYGNGVRTNYDYDPLTFRLVYLLTLRNPIEFPDDCPQPSPNEWPGCQVQNLQYTYDPAGNITHTRDAAQQTIYFRNKRVEPSAEYTYDALYQLIEATGREHLGQTGAPVPPSYNDVPRIPILLSGSDGNAMGRYLERYVHDSVGNFQEIVHRGSDPVNPGWTRTFSYNEPSQLEPGARSNRLTLSTIGTSTETYSTGGNGYDAHGNMLRMPQLQIMRWNFTDQLQMTQRQAVAANDEEGLQNQGERTWYVYDAGGQRVRKVTELASGQIKDQRLYLGVLEIYRRNSANPLVRETLQIMDDRQRIAMVDTRTQGAEPSPQQRIRYQLGNHLGSSSLELDEEAQIISYEEYTPYGSSSYQAVGNQTETPKRYRYSGKERDEESGLYYHGARYYAPWLAKWIAPDPAGTADGLNLYRYVRNNPLIHIDPTGTTSVFIAQQRDTTKYPKQTPKQLTEMQDENRNFRNRAMLLNKKVGGVASEAKAFTGEQILNVLVDESKKGPIKNVVLFGHSGPTALYPTTERGLYRYKADMPAGVASEARALGDLKGMVASGQVKFDKEAVIILAGCKAAGSTSAEPGSFARIMANDTERTVIASVGGSDQFLASMASAEKMVSVSGWIISRKVGNEVKSYWLDIKPSFVKDSTGKSRRVYELDPTAYLETGPGAKKATKPAEIPISFTKEDEKSTLPPAGIAPGSGCTSGGCQPRP